MQRISKKWLAAALVVVVAAGAGLWWWLRPDDSTSTTAATTVTVSSQTVKQTVSATGTVEPLKSADLDFDVSGTVTAVLVSEGDKVVKGQALAEVDDTSLTAAKTASAAQLSAAKTQLSTDVSDDESAVQIASDKAAIVSAQDSYDSAVAAVKDAVLRATIGGTVTSVGVEVGDTVGSSGGSESTSSSGTSTAASTTSTSAVSIVTNGTWLVDATVASSDVDTVKKGLQAEITVTGVSDTIYGTVQSVGLVAETSSSGAAVFPVEIKVTGKRTDLFGGTSATASIIVKQTSDVITVASNALKTSGDETYVMKVVGGKAVKQVVTIGDTYGASTVVTKGLASGDKVQIPGFTRNASSGSSGGSGSSQSGDLGGNFGGGTPPTGGFGGGFGGGQ
ncbi:efflux RND transporter periplasmic adaptor subunit [Nocardioides sp. Kera G14]|uniref:efflux RND transporter periplasmic adaptor subunit n=1 Tax=Nocardioides sp. Kera G14 TaxID=2884264 RepID=UPI001D11D277|nr:efflux RND transporter periplasmic adaptor subunit [Nocardioides sp. Kera G14]UDY22560.1 efflux RND transporter periplasmic adaptor subunit [Nocardioides sp. Kera G14]